mmetsp:Transcript_7338/g.16040  ORF Transcript_7338/g.16040 Transcript_7338/m.16040 type:complete len:202 (-) Transcript_7338:383-988(-)
MWRRGSGATHIQHELIAINTQPLRNHLVVAVGLAVESAVVPLLNHKLQGPLRVTAGRDSERAPISRHLNDVVAFTQPSPLLPDAPHRILVWLTQIQAIESRRTRRGRRGPSAEHLAALRFTKRNELARCSSPPWRSEDEGVLSAVLQVSHVAAIVPLPLHMVVDRLGSLDPLQDALILFGNAQKLLLPRVSVEAQWSWHLL